MTETFIQLKRCETTNDLLECHPNAFLLLTQIALRARRVPNLIKKLDVCECQVGDYRKCGLSEQKYRTAKSVLEKLNLVNFQSTNKGTVAKLINTDIYNINADADNGQVTNQQRTSNEQATTNNNVNKENNLNNEKNLLEQEFEKFWKLYNKKDGKKKCISKWNKLKPKDKEIVFETLPLYVKSTPDVTFRKNPLTYLNGEHWNDEITNNTKMTKTETDNANFKDPTYYGADSPITDESLF